MSELGSGVVPKRSVWTFNAEAVGCRIGPPTSKDELKEWSEKYPAGHVMRDMCAPMPTEAGPRTFEKGSGKTFCSNGMFSHQVRISKRFVACKTAEAAKRMGVTTKDRVCADCFLMPHDPTEKPCEHKGEFLGFFGNLTKVLKDITQEPGALDGVETDSIHGEATRKQLQQKVEEVSAAKRKAENETDKRKVAEAEAADLRAELDRVKAQLAEASVKAKS